LDPQTNTPDATGGASLTSSKVLAGGMASATSAVLGSYFGALGTVGGAAAGSVATMLSTAIYQRSIERTHDRMRRRAPRGSPARPTKASAARRQGHRPARLFTVTVIGTIVIFALGIGVVTGIELIRGAPLSGGDHGTSVSRVLQPSSSTLPTNPASPSDHSLSDETNPSPPRGDSPRTQSHLPSTGNLHGILPSETTDPSDSTQHHHTNQPQTPGTLDGLLPNGPRDSNN
jgi:hypothetical protein